MKKKAFRKRPNNVFLGHSSLDLFCSIGLRQHFSWKCGSDLLFNIFGFKSFFILQSNLRVDGLHFQTLKFPIISVSKVSSSGCII